ncbi:uncharacterized protein LOC122650603 [Telopea speciosissima]|uniref:uncharacterized protein LOC122650603 n=1 Tax=Telopea speciosissima TaxID=54955 RepID=UPI001CC348EA|nr:uncharacterized protein LOC122650603 [Telopea speciosissima]
MGFCVDFIHNERVGKNPNLWIIWRNSFSKPVVYSSSDQQITIFMEVRSKKFFLLAVHASSLRARRRDLWVHLSSQPISSLPWLVVGDFNATLLASEKRGPGAFHTGVAMDFAAFLDSTSLLPLPSKGNRFTGSNNRKQGNASVVLDRSLCNHAWLDHYHDAYQRLEHKDFAAVVRQSWGGYVSGSPFYVVTQKLKGLKVALIGWSRAAFPNVNIEVDRARAALEDAQEIMETVGTTEIQALTCGDRNTRFFHLATKIRHSKNLVRVLKKADGTVLNDGPQINTYVTEYYEAFHKRVTTEAWLDILSCIPSIISANDNIFLTAVPSREEIKATTFDLDPDSAPGLDGFPGAFYRSCWEIIESDVCRAVSRFFVDGIITKGINNNFIMLIPKVEEALTLDKFRPICVGNFLYKLIPKILATRLSGFLPRLISEEQGAFQKGKVIFSNICVASELTNILHMKSYGGGMGLKLDIQKAYDSMEWDFMFNVMRKFGFNNKWVNMIYQLLSSAWLSILLNGGPIGFFGVERGLRQGDPLAPLLFIIVEVLCRGFAELQSSHKITPYQDLEAQANEIIEVLWKKPSFDWVKLNIDGCSLGNPGHSSAAGIFRNSQGQPEGSYAEYLGIATNHTAEFTAFFIGVQMACDMHVRRLWIECDAEIVVAAIKNGNIPWKFKQAWLGMANYLQGIRWEITHNYREANTVADLIAKKCASTHTSQRWGIAPPYVHYEIEWDLQERSRFRFR